MAYNITQLFTRIGYILGRVNDTNIFVGSTEVSGMTALAAQYTGTDDAFIDGWTDTLGNLQGSVGGYTSTLQQYANNTVIGSVNEYTLQKDTSLSTSLAYVITQMQSQAQTVKRCTVSGTAAAASGNNGSGAWVISTLTQGGLPLENMYNETLTATVLNDSQSGGVTAGSEIINVVDTQNQTNSLSYLWPQGSGVNTNIVATNPLIQSQQSGIGVNVLNNSSFVNWTGSVPNGWVVNVGSITQATGTVFDGTYSVEFVGDGSSHTSIQQQFNSSNGTAVSLNPLITYGTQGLVSQYLFNGYFYVNNVPAAGVLQIALVDGSGTILNDAQGTPNSINVNLHTQITASSWTPFGGAFRTGTVLPSNYYLQLSLTTALSNTTNLFINKLALAQGNQLYTGGPYVMFVSKTSSPVLINGDNWSLNMANNYAGKFQQGFQKLFNMSGLGLLLPSTTGSYTISEGLIQ